MSFQSAPLLIEEMNPPADPPDKVGQSQWGSIHLPSQGVALFYSDRVSDLVDAACAKSKSCEASTGEIYPDALKFRYLQWLKVHELLHVMYCVKDTPDRHWSGEIVMKPAIVHTENNRRVTYYIPGVISNTTREDVGFFPSE